EKCDFSVNKEQDCISLKKAKEINPSVEVGEILEIEVDPKKDFNFYGSRDFKNKFNEELLKFQRENIFNFFKKYENKLMIAEVIEEKLKFFVLELEKKFKTFIFKKDLMSNDNFYIGEKIFVLITGVHNTTPKHLQISVSRVNNQFIIELFKYFIPEIKDGIVQIMAIARSTRYVSPPTNNKYHVTLYTRTRTNRKNHKIFFVQTSDSQPTLLTTSPHQGCLMNTIFE
ncbi:MAG: NusA N-terminal domain-containing protein, partial [Sweet potato little leaf phytoplasma]|nr:NusA N-terminal domain-containing protein [Sweet potato little leaf phytoplasma]